MVYLLSAALVAVVAFLASLSLGAAGVGALLGLVIGYLGLPVLAPLSFTGPLVLALVGAVVGTAVAIVREESGGADRTRQATLLVVGLLVGGLGLNLVTTAPVLHAAAYRQVLGPVDTTQNAPNVAPIDPTQLRIVDGALAEKLAERVLGTDGALGSQAKVGRMDLQLVNGQWLWVAPLDHAGFWRWVSNMDQGTPGYVTVSAVDPRDVKLVTALNGKPLHLRYNEGAYFAQDLERHLYGHGFATTGLTDFTFELDDAGAPHYVITTYDHVVGFAGKRATGAVILDPATGETERCAPEKCPAWVDIVHPADLTEAQVADWGEYVHGWFNPSKQDQLQPTGGVTRVLGNDGHLYHYVGLTSASADKGAVGFMMVNVRTGKATFYRQAGSTEDAAMAAVAGAVQEKRYHPVNPTPYLIDGIWTRMVPLKDDAGFVKAIGFVAVANDQILAVGDTPDLALRRYRQVLAGSARVTADRAVATVKRTGTVARVAADTRNGETTYFVMLAGDTVAFMGNSSLTPALPLTRVGDHVTVEARDNGSVVLDLVTFGNTDLRALSAAPIASGRAASAAASSSSAAAVPADTAARDSAVAK